MDAMILREMREWAALGFYEAVDLPWPRAYGRAMRRLYEDMDIRLREGAMLFPCEPFPIAASLSRDEGKESWYWSATSGPAHHATGYLCDFMHHCGLHANEELVREKKAEFPQHAAFIDALMADLRRRLQQFGGYTHTNPDMRRVVTEGFDAMERELDEQIARSTADPAGNLTDPLTAAEPHLLAALKDYCIGVRAFHQRTLAAVRAAADAATGARRNELKLIADSFARGFLAPARTFIEGLLAVHFTWILDGCDSIGRVDQVLGKLFERDINNGKLDLDLARRLIDEMFSNFERLNAWNMQIGGYRPDGVDGCNALTRELLAACQRNRIRRPNMAFRITRQTPPDVLCQAIEVLRGGTGRPALYNDDLYVASLLRQDLHLTEADAREIGFGGCTETMIAGLSNVGSLEGNLNVAKALELAIHDGRDPLSGQQRGPHTGTFESFADFQALLGAVRRQIQYMTDAFVAGACNALHRRFTEGDPKLYRTFFTRDCVSRRRSFEAGGARYNWAVVSYGGIPNLIDSLAAIRKCVFEDRTVSAGDLLAALKADFAEHEPLRRKLLAAPKFGNDNPYVDELGREIIEYAWRELLSHETPRGGRFLPSCIMFTTYAAAGSLVGALPDGRTSRSPLGDSTGPVQGRDTHGPTAMLRSVSRLPLYLAAGTPVLNIRFQKSLLDTGDGIAAAASLVRTFFEMGGMQIQLSVISRKDMLAAQKSPDEHRDLIVRIGGYSEYFTKLSKALQDSVIERTEHGAA